MRSNQLSVIPTDMGQLQNLQWLCLAENQLEDLPEELGQLESLVYLNLNSNKCSSVPECVLKLSGLVTLHMKNNHVSKVPDNTILALSQLSRLDLRDNYMRQRPGHWKVSGSYAQTRLTRLDQIRQNDTLEGEWIVCTDKTD